MKIPSWLTAKLDEEGLQRIERAIAAAEKRTSGEIVPMIVRRSASTGHVALALTLALALAFEALGLGGQWFGDFGGSPLWLALSILLAIPLALGLARFDSVQRLFTLDADLTRQVQLRAEVEFYEAGLQKTSGSTGILIFLSWMEREAVVLADRGIAEKLPPDTWTEVIRLVLEPAHQGRLAEGLAQGIEKCGELLQKEFPIQAGDRNELLNHLIVKD